MGVNAGLRDPHNLFNGLVMGCQQFDLNTQRIMGRTGFKSHLLNKLHWVNIPGQFRLHLPTLQKLEFQMLQIQVLYSIQAQLYLQ